MPAVLALIAMLVLLSGIGLWLDKVEHRYLEHRRTCERCSR